jgi:predicted nucleic acid-binding Zn ribbon protein
MAQKSLGFVELVWICPNCSTKNSGPQKTCQNCGNSQPEDVDFIQDVQAEILQDEAKIAKAEAGPDIHCFYCGTRNPAGATTCSQCGGDLTQGEKRRTSQQVGAYKPDKDAKIICPACDKENEARASECIQCGANLHESRPAESIPEQIKQTTSKRETQPTKSPSIFDALFGIVGMAGLAGLAFVLCGCMVLFYFMVVRTTDLSGQVQSVSWERTIIIEEEKSVEREDSDWQDEVPAEATVISCSDKIRDTQNNPPVSGNYKEVCGTPYTVDKGSGFGNVVQDCEYEIYDDWCKYNITELKWTEVDRAVRTGNDLNPRWPEIGLKSGQRGGDRIEIYKVFFDTTEGQKLFNPDDEGMFKRCTVGSQWTLKVNVLGTVNGIE